MELVTGVRKAAKYLECGERTIHRLVDLGEFPEPESIIYLGNGVKIRAWRKEDLKAYRPKLRRCGKPRKIRAQNIAP